MAAQRFHSRTGSLVTLSNDNRTAQRNQPTQEFNNGVVLSAEPLKDNQLFEVKIIKKVSSWSGSIEIGVTTCDPNIFNFPVSATGFREGTWVMSGSSVLRDGHAMFEEYGTDLDDLSEGDKIGVMRSSSGVLHFFVNGTDQGSAATSIPPNVYAVVDLYGKCSEVIICNNSNRENTRLSNDIVNELANEFIAQLSNQITNNLTSEQPPPPPSAPPAQSNEWLTFHEKCGSLVKLSNSRRTAERRKPLDEFNHGVVMTNRPIKCEEVFEIRLDRLVDKWSGSIEVGTTTHNPTHLEFPATMTNMRSGSGYANGRNHPFYSVSHCTIMMSGCGILTNGKGTRREYGSFNLDDLAEGDRIGLVQHEAGDIHYFINGVDQGEAIASAPTPLWGVVDLYGMAVKVTILNSSDSNYCSNIPSREIRSNNIFRQYPDMYDEETLDDIEVIEKLLFHPRCGSHAAVINGGRTAHRPNAFEDFNNGVVLTNRALRPNETFEVRIDQMIDKWAGSIEIGVTLHSSHDLEFPSTMTNIRAGTWMMTGNGVMHNGTTVLDDYGQNLDRLKVGDRVGVVRQEDGTLHFFVNGEDQGPAVTKVPDTVFGVIDLYGQAAQATIVDQTNTLSSPEVESVTMSENDELRFHELHGQNASLVHSGRTAIRPNASGEFNDAIVMSSRALRDNELFEIAIEKMVDRWSGSIEAGITLIPPEDLDFPNTMTDIDHDTWMLSGSAIMQDGSTIRNSYSLDLDTILIGWRVGMMRCSDGTLHFYLNGVDQGVACSDIPRGIYAVIDLYGQCSQVSVTSGSIVLPTDNQPNIAAVVEPPFLSPTGIEVTHQFSTVCGLNINVKDGGCVAQRTQSFEHGIVFSSEPLRHEECFEIRVDSLSKIWSGSLIIGLTTLAISDTTPRSVIPSTISEFTHKPTWIISGSQVKKCGVIIKENYAPSLDRLDVGTKVGIKRCSDGSMRVYVNQEDMGVAATNIPKNVFAVIDLFGKVTQISIISSAVLDITNNSLTSPSLVSDNVENTEDGDHDLDTAEQVGTEFHYNHGKNIMMSNSNQTAERTASYNQGIVVCNRTLQKNTLFQVKIDKLNRRWSSSLMIGVLSFTPDRYSFPVSAVGVRKACTVIQSDTVFSCGSKIKERYGPNLDSLLVGHIVGVMIDDDNCLHLYVNDVDQGIAVRDVATPCRAFVDLYGQCEQVTIVAGADRIQGRTSHDKEKGDIEDVMKEKVTRPPAEQIIIRNCEYQNSCSRIKATMGLPDGYFDPQLNTCFCEACVKIRGDDSYHRQGDPPVEYATPIGWCRFGLRMPNKSHSLNVIDKWHVAFHGTRHETLRRTLDRCDLHVHGDDTGSGNLLLPQSNPFTEKSKPDDCDIKPILLSPTIKYAGLCDFAAKHTFNDPKTKKSYQVRVVFQVWVKPSSYKVSPPSSLATHEQIDPKFNNHEIEWSTKERGSTRLHGLLIKLD